MTNGAYTSLNSMQGGIFCGKSVNRKSFDSDCKQLCGLIFKSGFESDYGEQSNTKQDSDCKQHD